MALGSTGLSPESFLSMMEMDPFPVAQWGMTPCVPLPPEFARTLEASMRRAHFALVPSGKLREGASLDRSFVDTVGWVRYGVSFTTDFRPECMPGADVANSRDCPALVLTFPPRETDVLRVYTGFLVDLDKSVYFSDGVRFWDLKDSHVCPLLYWRKA